MKNTVILASIGMALILVSLFTGAKLSSDSSSNDMQEEISRLRNENQELRNIISAIEAHDGAGQDMPESAGVSETGTQSELTLAPESDKQYEDVALLRDCEVERDAFEDVVWAKPVYEEILGTIEGKWIGCIYTPWRSSLPLAIDFSDSGQYRVEKLAASGDAALYYGTDLDSEDKIIRFYDVQDSGAVWGEITITFNDGDTTRSNFYDMRVTGNRLQFSFLHKNSVGPLELVLVRANQ